jgi:hypothetical protein
MTAAEVQRVSPWPNPEDRGGRSSLALWCADEAKRLLDASNEKGEVAMRPGGPMGQTPWVLTVPREHLVGQAGVYAQLALFWQRETP